MNWILTLASLVVSLELLVASALAQSPAAPPAFSTPAPLVRAVPEPIPDAPPVPAPETPPAPVLDLELSPDAAPVAALLSLAVMLAVNWIKARYAIPPAAIVALAPALAWAAAALGSLHERVTIDPWLAAGIGLAATGLFEMSKQFRKAMPGTPAAVESPAEKLARLEKELKELAATPPGK